jgi:hypothetical protein
MTRREHDNYSTDPGLARWAVKHAMNMAVLPDGPLEGKIVEPCCGDAAPFAAAGKEFGLVPYGFDIRDVRPLIWNEGGVGMGQFKVHDANVTRVHPFVADQDFDGGGFDIVATNPPFSIGEDVVRKSLAMLKPQGCAVFLVKMAFLSTQERSKLFVSRPPAEVWILRARPSFTGDGNTDVAQEYAFVFWQGAGTDSLMKAIGQRVTRLFWLDNSTMMGKRAKRVTVAKETADE